MMNMMGQMGGQMGGNMSGMMNGMMPNGGDVFTNIGGAQGMDILASLD